MIIVPSSCSLGCRGGGVGGGVGDLTLWWESGGVERRASTLITSDTNADPTAGGGVHSFILRRGGGAGSTRTTCSGTSDGALFWVSKQRVQGPVCNIVLDLFLIFVKTSYTTHKYINKSVYSQDNFPHFRTVLIYIRIYIQYLAPPCFQGSLVWTGLCNRYSYINKNRSKRSPESAFRN